MEVPQIIELVRFRLADEVADYLWPDPVLYAALDETMRVLAMRTECLKGQETLTILAGAEAVPLPPHLYAPLRIQFGSDSYSIIPGYAPVSGSTGVPRAFYHENNAIYARPKPTEDAVLTVDSVLLPRVPARDNPVLEIPPEYHMALVSGTTFYALQTFDVDRYDSRRLQVVANLWESELLGARTLANIHGREPQPVRYGGI